MKTLLTLFLFVGIVLQSASSLAQPICGFDGAHAKLMKENADYRKNVLSAESSIRNFIHLHPKGFSSPHAAAATQSATAVQSIATASSNATTSSGITNSSNTTASSAQTLSTALYTIPVVVNVIHTGGEVGTLYNPTDAQIIGAIDYLNAVYNGSYTGTAGVGDLQIQFVLAQRDPNCNPTNGINRVDGSGIAGYVSGGVNRNTTLGTDEINVKNLSRWDPTQYYNVWIVDKIDGNDGTSGTFIAGYAYFPGSPTTLDGIVMLATQMVAGQKTLPHEMGHAFNLYHPFQGSTDVTICPANTDCSVDGDQVCDTDPISYNYNSGTGVIDFTCRTGTNSCTGTAYSTNTENNYMNYTYCYDLFTAGQKSRLLASAASSYRSSLSASMGGTPPSQGSTPCTLPKIDFELSGDQQTETTAAASGCRAYKDYAYNMVIGVGPSADATVTLTTSGAAIQGLDYDITTNGSFTSPSQQLIFPAGSTASQPFTIRIYDDASVNGTRTATLGFTVNNGGGNAIAGDSRPDFTLTIDDNDTPPTGGTTTGTASIGSAAYGINAAPFDVTQQSLRTQFQYKASELTAAGVQPGELTGLSVYMVKHSSRAYTNLNINLGTTTTPYLVNSGSVTLGSGMTTVKTLASCNTVNGWNAFTFDSPFIWDGTSDLVVEVCYDNGTTASSDAADVVYAYADGGSSTQGNTIYQDGVNCSQSFSAVTYYPAGIKPILQLNYGTPATVVQTVLNSSQSLYLGPYADIYFYDQTNGELMGRIQNGSSFNYGCTQLIIDRAGTNATAFWNNNVPNYLMDKTFHVIPTTNNTSGNYTITLYYTQSEVNGWQTYTGQSLSAIQLVKVPSQISNVTPSNPTGGGTITQVTPAISTLGTNTGLSYTFSNGFSGFGAGVPGSSVLPIGLLSFTGKLENNNALLNWATSFEQNSQGFDVERSFDGSHFSSIGYVPSAGNSDTTRYYNFTDPYLTQSYNYYRLQQQDLDGHSTYSNIVLIKDSTSTGSIGFTVSPNPFTGTSGLDILFAETPNGSASLRLLDITGRELLQLTNGTPTSNRWHIDLSGITLSSGIYLLEVHTQTGVQVARVVKK